MMILPSCGYQRWNQGAREKQFEEFDLATICVNFLISMSLAQSKGVTMVVDAATPVSVRGDQDLMREALSNLIDNAINSTPTGGAVRIEARMADGRPFALVSDTGVGIAPEERAKYSTVSIEAIGAGKRPNTGSVSARRDHRQSAWLQTDC